MNPSEWDEGYARTSDRMPHNGWAGYGPYEDKGARLAERLLVVLVVVGWILFATGVL